MKKLRTILIAAAMMMCGSAMAYDFEVDSTLYYTITDSVAKTVCVAIPESKPTGNITIPETVIHEGETYTVDSIANMAFYGAKAMTSLVIPATVKGIGFYAFLNCTALETLTIEDGDVPLSLTSSCFSGCTALTAITIPTRLTVIPSSCFSGCESLKTITLHSAITAIERQAFHKCYALESITIPCNLDALNGFSYCTSLKEVTFTGTIREIENYAFAGCSALESITLPEGLEVVSGFQECTALTAVTLPSTVTTIESYAFSNTPLAAIALPDSLNTMGEYAFYKTALSELTIPDAVTTIGTGAFAADTLLTKVTIGAGIEEVSVMAFAECPAITDVYAYRETPPTTTVSAYDSDDQKVIFSETTLTTATLHVPAGCKEAYSSSDYWAFTTIVEDAVSSINELNIDAVNSTKTGIYNLRGMKVEAPTSKGIYIKNGKKVVY